MEIQKYTGVMAEIIEAINEAGMPPTVRRIQVTEDEMQEIVTSQAFRIAIANYYGGTSAPTFEGIKTAFDGKILSLYLGGVCISVGPYVPTGALGDVAYEPLVETGKAETTFNVVADDGNAYMLSGVGNPADDFVLGKNADIELGLAIRKYNDQTYYGDGSGVFDIELGADEKWTFAVTAGSLNPGVPNITEMYDISLHLDTDPSGASSPLVWNLMLGDTPNGKNYVWYNGPSRVISDSATNAEISVTQMIQQYAFRFINDYVPRGVERNKAGSPYGEFSILLQAKPRFGTGDAVSVMAMASIVKKS